MKTLTNTQVKILLWSAFLKWMRQYASAEPSADSQGETRFSETDVKCFIFGAFNRATEKRIRPGVVLECAESYEDGSGDRYEVGYRITCTGHLNMDLVLTRETDRGPWTYDLHYWRVVE